MTPDSILQGLNTFLNTFGSITVIPVVLFIISLCFGIKLKLAFTSSLYAGIGLTGFTWIISQYLPIILPAVQNMVLQTGIQLPVVDIGWQATALVAYASRVGMVYLAVGLLFQLFIFITGWTNVFQPSGLWDNYSYMLWGSLVYAATQDLLLALALMITLNLWATLGYEVLAKRWATYYHYPNCTIVQLHNAEVIPFALLANWLLNRLGAGRIRWQPRELYARLGFFGDPVRLGFLLGLLLGVLGNINRLGTLQGWGNLALVTIATTTVIAVFPRIADLFAQAFTPLAEASRRFAQAKNRAEIYIGVDDAAAYGESATLISGIVLIPIMVVIAALVPGNKMLPLVDLIALPFMVEAMVAFSNGNIFKVIVAMAAWFALGMVSASAVAPLFTQVYQQVTGAQLAGGGFVASFSVMSKPFWVGFTLITTHWRWLGVGVLFASYWPLALWFKRNQARLLALIESEAGQTALEAAAAAQECKSEFG